jgi:beta-lactamase regulating signal transducer with metallopeptidase domain
MNADVFSADAAWQLAGWTMLHFLWVGTGIAVAGAAACFACRRASPNVRYAASLATFVLLAASPVVIAVWLAGHSETGAFAAEETIAFESAAADSATWGSFSETPESVDLRDSRMVDKATDAVNGRQPIVDAAVGNPSPSPSLRGRGIDAPLARLVTWLPVAWLVGTPMTFAMLAAGLVGSQRLRRSGAMLTDGHVVDACARLQRVLGVARRVGLAVCDGLAQPVLVGIVKPTILLPAATLAGWSPEQLEMVLLHELAHVRRWDNLVNLGQRLVESLLFFHPAVWLVSRQVRRDREECCDAVVVAHSGKPEAYASLLVTVAASLRNIRGSSLATASALADHALAGRVRRILKLEDEPMWISRRMLALLVVLSLGLSTAAYRVAFAVPAPIETTAEEPTASSDSREQTASTDGEDVAIRRVYPINDEDIVNFRELVKLLGRQHVEILWLDDTNGLIVSAPQRVHEQVAEFLAQSRGRRGIHFESVELPRLRAEIMMYQDQLDQTAIELNDLEVMKELALMSGPASGHIDLAVNDSLDNDPAIKKHQVQLLTLSQQIEQLIASTRNPNNASLKRLKAQYAQIEQQMERIRAAAEKEIRDRLIKIIPNEALRPGMVEYNVRKEYLNKKKAELEARIKADEERLAGKIVGAETAVDDSAVLKTQAIHDDDGSVLIESLPTAQATPPGPWKLAPGDGVLVRVVGAIPEQPIDDIYYIEPEGTLALGPAYGRVKVAGKTIYEAEPIVKAHLSKILTDADVQITLVVVRGAASDGPSPNKPSYRYNGKTLDQWRQESRYELMIGRRIDAINAFAVFGQTAMPSEATEAIFDVAGEYDLAHAYSADLKAFRSAVVKGLRAENGAGIPSATWLPVLADRYASDATKWKPLTLFLLSQLQTRDKAPSDVLEKFEASDDEEIRAAANAAREGRAGPPGGQVLPSDPPRSPTGWQQPAPDHYEDERRQ